MRRIAVWRNQRINHSGAHSGLVALTRDGIDDSLAGRDGGAMISKLPCSWKPRPWRGRRRSGPAIADLDPHRRCSRTPGPLLLVNRPLISPPIALSTRR